MNENSQYCVVPCEPAPIGFGVHVAGIPGRKQRVVMSTPLRSLVNVCSSSGTLAELAERAVKWFRFASGDVTSIGAVLEELRQQELLITLDQLFPRNGLDKPVACPIRSVAVPTGDRPDQLQRLLQSFSPHFLLHDRPIEWIIVEDSSNPQARSKYLQIIANHHCDGQSMRWAGAAEKNAYLSELIRVGIDPVAARFALLGEWREDVRSCGANRNAILFDTLGDRVLSIDDDVVCQMAKHPQTESGLRVQGHLPARECWFFEDRLHARREAIWDADRDLLQAHERLLGKSVQEFAAEIPVSNISIESACTHLIKELVAGGGGRVVATMMGVIGDAGVHAASPWLTIQGPSFERMVQSESTLSAAVTTREILAVANVDTVTHDPYCQAMAIALANDIALPPFLPVGRNQDGVFGTLVHLMAPLYLFGHLPLAILHDPDGKREYSPLAQFRMAELIIALTLHLTPPHRQGSADFIQYLGTELVYLAELSESDFWDCIVRTATLYESERLRRLEASLKRAPNAPAFWRQAIDRTHEKLVKQIEQPYSFIPLELRNKAPYQAQRRTRELINLTGRLFYHWPDLLDAASLLRQRGIRVSVESARA